MDQAMEQRRAKWLSALKVLTEKCAEREARIYDMCPQRYSSLDGKDKKESLKAIARLSKEINAQVQRLNELEQNGEIGFSAVLGKQPDELTVVVLALLVSARLDANVAHLMRSVQDAINQSAVRDPSASLQTRNMFRSDGVLFPLVVLGRSVCTDQASLTLRESVLNRILGLPIDQNEIRCDAEALVNRNR